MPPHSADSSFLSPNVHKHHKIISADAFRRYRQILQAAFCPTRVGGIGLPFWVRDRSRMGGDGTPPRAQRSGRPQGHAQTSMSLDRLIGLTTDCFHRMKKPSRNLPFAGQPTEANPCRASTTKRTVETVASLPPISCSHAYSPFQIWWPPQLILGSSARTTNATNQLRGRLVIV
jgi:hypothetical protein